MDRPLISIVLPVLNGARYLRQSIESCLDQSYDSIELILVDDGSTDSTLAIFEEYLRKDRRVRVFSHANNRGLPHALNTGFAAAAGQYLTWSSADNYYRQHAMARMVEVLEEDSKVDFVYSDLTILDSQDHFVEHWIAGKVQDLVLINRIGACFLYRRKVHEVLGKYAEDMFLAEDYDFWLRASVCFQMVPIHEDLYCCRDQQNSLSVGFGERCLAVSDRCLERNLPTLTWATRPDKASAYFMLARRAQLRREWRHACRLAFSAFRLAPVVSLGILVQKILRRQDPAASGQAR
jgi:glycosyltransferase involved in cell wall biosynthesis